VVLLVVSFLVVVAPLVVAIGIGVVNVNRLSEGAADALVESTPLASRSKQIALDVRELQRHSQYAATIGPDNDAYPSLVNAFARSQERLAANIRELLANVDDPEAQAQLEALLARSASLVGNVGTNPRDPAQQALIDEMYDLSAWWASHGEHRSRAQGERVREAAESTSQTLQRLLVTAIPTALLLIVLFTFLISTSLRQITRAIKQLGENQFDDPIRVRGPADLRTLGDELDALRLRLH
jgi:two-component system sensor histidine kinase GlrK